MGMKMFGKRTAPVDYIIHVEFKHHSSSIPDAEAWCKKVSIPYYNGLPNPMYFSFKNETDAMMFKLAWG